MFSSDAAVQQASDSRHAQSNVGVSRSLPVFHPSSAPLQQTTFKLTEPSPDIPVSSNTSVGAGEAAQAASSDQESSTDNTSSETCDSCSSRHSDHSERLPQENLPLSVQEVAQNQEEVDQLRQEISELSQLVAQKNKDMQTCMQEIERLKCKVEELEEDVSGKSVEKEYYAKCLEIKTTYFAEVEQDKSRFVAKVDEARAKFDEAIKENERLERELENKRRRAMNLELDNQELKMKLTLPPKNIVCKICGSTQWRRIP